MRRPLCIEMFAGTFGWSAGWLALGGQVVGFDLEHEHWHGPVPPNAELVLQDVLTLHGSQFKDADLILSSSPCQQFSYRAMPWKRAKALGPPELGMELFHAQFRIQREASEAAGRWIPMVVENVRGAQPWVGKSRWNFGSYHLWGDVPAMMPATLKGGTKVAGMNWSGSDKPGYKAVAFNDTRHHKVPSEMGRRTDIGKGARFATRDCGVEAAGESRKVSRKAAAAHVARIPDALSHHIAQTYWPRVPLTESSNP